MPLTAAVVIDPTEDEVLGDGRDGALGALHSGRDVLGLLERLDGPDGPVGVDLHTGGAGDGHPVAAALGEALADSHEAEHARPTEDDGGQDDRDAAGAGGAVGAKGCDGRSLIGIPRFGRTLATRSGVSSLEAAAR